MNNKLGVVLALVLCLVIGVLVYFWQENRISSLLDDNQKINAENEQLKKNIEEAENKLEALILVSLIWYSAKNKLNHIKSYATAFSYNPKTHRKKSKNKIAYTIWI